MSEPPKEPEVLPSDDVKAPLETRPDEGTLVKPEEMPVVTRMVIEIRSDGVRTMARGAIEDLVQDKTVAIELAPMTPSQLSGQLSKTLSKAMVEMPILGRMALRSLVPDPVRRLKRRLFGSKEPEGSSGESSG